MRDAAQRATGGAAMSHPADKAWSASTLDDDSAPALAFRAGWDAAMKQRAKRAAFVPPKLGEVRDYLDEIGAYSVNACDIWDYYQSKGWLIGGRPMKDWRAACRRWVRSPFNQQQSQPQEMRAINSR